jgi:type VI secretion system protein ImpJ
MWKNRVLWSEGLFLRPQHFQQQERFLEALVDQRVRGGQPYCWGFSSLELDAGALARGEIQIAQASGVWPDGTTFNIPDHVAPPPPLVIGPQVKDRMVALAIPVVRQGVPSTSFGAEQSRALPRFEPAEYDSSDSNEGFDETAPLQVARLRCQLVVVAGNEGAYSTLGVARVIERRADGQVLLDRNYIPPSLHIEASASLRSWLAELRGLVTQRSEVLSQRMAEPGRGGTGEIADFLMLMLTNRFRPWLDHLSERRPLHPEQFYVLCIQLLGELASFGNERRLQNRLPSYDHDDLESSFLPVMTQLRLALSMVLEQSAIPIELHDRKFGVRVAVFSDKSFLPTASFILAVNAQMPTEQVRVKFPAQVKIGPVEKIRDLVNLQLPGVALRPLPIAPRQIPYHAGCNYFELDTKSELWRMLDRSGGLAMHVAGEFPGLELEFWAIRQ